MMFRTHEIGGVVACTAALPLLVNSELIKAKNRENKRKKFIS